MENTVTVVIPTYNRAKFLKDVSLPSVLGQTRPPIECIVVDDGSTDGTKAVVEDSAKKYPEFPLIYVFQKNAGVAAARNAGIDRAKGKWVLCLDSDDALLPEAIDTLTAEAARSGADVVTGRTWRVVRQSGRIKGIGGSTPSSVILKKKVFSEFGPYDEDRDIIEDVDHVYRLEPVFESGAMKISRLGTPLAIYFSHAGQVTSLTDAQKLAVKEVAMIKKWEPLMPKTPHGRENLARLWRNKGVYEVLARERRAGILSLKRSLSYRPSAFNCFLLTCAFLGRWSFKAFVLPLRDALNQLSFSLAYVAFKLKRRNEARSLLQSVRRIANAQ